MVIAFPKILKFILSYICTTNFNFFPVCSMNRPRCWSAYGLRGQLQFHLTIIHYLPRYLLTLVHRWRWVLRLFIPWAALRAPSCGRRRFAPGWKAFAASTAASEPDHDPHKPSWDWEGPPCQVWGRWDQRCGRPFHTNTHTHLTDIYKMPMFKLGF